MYCCEVDDVLCYMRGCGDGGKDLQKKLKGLSLCHVLCLNALTHTGCARKTREEVEEEREEG